jgi:uncharacterized delta-60 repeat protein
MLNNSINYSNLISAGAISNSLNNDNLFIIGVRNQQFGGDYRPIVVEWSTILNEVISNLPPFPPFPPIPGPEYLNIGNSTATTSINWSLSNVQEVNLVGNTVFSFSNPTIGETYKLLLKQTTGPGTISTIITNLAKRIKMPSSFIWSNYFQNAPDLKTSLWYPNPNNSNSWVNDTVNCIDIQPDGKYLIGGAFTNINIYGLGGIRTLRLNPDGSQDGSFNNASFSGVNGDVRAIRVAPDGKKIYIGGSFTAVNGVNVRYLARLNSDGTPDTTFNIGINLNDAVNSIDFLSDGRIVIGGQFTSYGATSRNRIAVINIDGTLNTAFNPSTGFNSAVYKVVVEALNDAIIVSGTYSTYQGATANRIIRLLINGNVDSTFDMGTGFNSDVTDIQIQSWDNKIILSGAFTTFKGSTANRIVRVSQFGALDTTFNTNIGTAANGQVYRVGIDQTNRLLFLFGSFSTWNSTSGSPFDRKIVMLNENGTRNTFSFEDPLPVFFNSTNAFAVTKQNKYLIGGNNTFTNGGVTPRLCLFNQDLSPVGYPTNYTEISMVWNGTSYVQTT